MPKTHKSLDKQNLAQYATWITDDNPTSTYFQVSQMPEVLTTGKNAFLINGSEYLNPKTEVKIEIVDANGRVVYQSPIRNYAEGLARLVSIEVYSDAAPGLATLTILGDVLSAQDGRIVPNEWRGKYNVRWSKKITIDKARTNATPIRFYNAPTAKVQESLMPYRPTSQSLLTLKGGAALSGIPLDGPGNEKIYTIRLSNITDPNVNFNRYMSDGEVRMVVNGQSYTASLDSVLNTTTAFLKGSTGFPNQFITPNFTMSFMSGPEFGVSAIKRSVATIELDNIRTFSGKVHRAKVFSRNVDSEAGYESLGDFLVEPRDFLVTASVSGVLVRTGEIVSQTTVNDHWVYGPMASGSLYTG